MIPNDPIMLVSYINTQLRDTYSSLDDLCVSLDIAKDEILSKLKTVGYHYDEEENKFIR